MQPSDSPPPAYPVQPSATSSFFSNTPPPLRCSPSSSSTSSASSSNPWNRSGTFLLSGSTAPPIFNTRRPPPFKGHSTPAFSSNSHGHSSSSSPSRQSSPVLMKEDKCVCCATKVSYPRGSNSFRCMVCQVTNDIPTKRSDSITEEHILELSHKFTSPPPPPPPPSSLESISEIETETDEALALRLHELELSRISNPSNQNPNRGEAEKDLLGYLGLAFSSLEHLDQCFLPIATSSTTTAPAIPRFETLRRFYELIQGNQDCFDMLRRMIEGLLTRPGEGIERLTGNWIMILLEAPVFSSVSNPHSQERRSMYSKFIGLLSNVSPVQHQRLVTYLSTSYPTHLLLSHIQLLIPHISHLILSSPSTTSPFPLEISWQILSSSKFASLLLNARNRSERGRDLIRVSEFWVMAIDVLGEDEWIRDYLDWEESANDEEYREVESSSQSFRFCQYPFLMSIGIKKRLMEYENQRRIMDEAAAAVRSNLASYRDFYGGGPEGEQQLPLLVLDIRRNRLVQDSLQQISMNRDSLRKSLRIKFEDEEGIDAGGLRKEWHLLLCKSLFSPSYGMFVTPSDEPEASGYMWFNPGSLGMVDEEDYWLLGAVIGLGCYHADTLNVPLPLATYKKLLDEPCTSLSDLAQFQPTLARGLQQLLDYEEDDIEEVFCRSFVGTYEAWGEIVEVELCEEGKEKMVNKENRQQYVSLLIDFILNKSISTQFEAFSSGFNEVCGGNALSLLRGEELELIVRGNEEEVLDIETLRSVTTLYGFYEDDQVILNFWEIFSSFEPKRQKQLLAFITASDRIPATGITSLRLKITCMGRVDSERLPSSRTCFSELCLWNYGGGKERLERLLITSMEESEGFGLR